MNINEECLLQFLNNPGRLDCVIEEFKNVVVEDNILNKEVLFNKLAMADA